MVRPVCRQWGVYFAMILPVIACFALAGCDSQEKAIASASPPPEVSVAKILIRPVQQWDEFNGRIDASQTVEVRSRVSGTVERVAFTDGQEVGRGELLFVIDPRPYVAALTAAQAQLERATATASLAQAQAKRAKALVPNHAISLEEFDSRMAGQAQSRAEVRAAEAAVAIARLNVEFTEVRAPIAGRASLALLTQGNLAHADQDLLTTLVPQDPVQVYFEPDEQSYLRYLELARNSSRTELPKMVHVGLANELGFPHQGQLDFTDNRVDPSTGTIRARAVLPNPERRFTPGLYARVQLDGGVLPNAMLIDERAVLTDQDRMYVYILGPDNKAVRKDVKLSTSVGHLRVVLSGLTQADEVVIDGLQKILYPGMTVQPLKVAMESVTATSNTPIVIVPAIQQTGK